jgi:hypothetical protein
LAASINPPRRKALRSWLCVEQLETRQLLSGYQPTVTEQVFLERLNDARGNPAAYGASIGLDLSGVQPAQPLAFNPLLIQAARNHAWDMNNRGFFSHVTPEGVGAVQRIRNAGLNPTYWGESLIAGPAFDTPEEALRGLIIDAGVPDLGHRRHLLSIDPRARVDNQIGIGVVQNASGSLENYWAIDSSATSDGRVYVTGVVYRDRNANGRYDADEGLGGVTITVSGGASTSTYQTGGYSLPLAPGTYTVTASGGELPAVISQEITIGAGNVRLNFIPRPLSKNEEFVRRLYHTALGRMASSAEAAAWLGVLQSTSRDAVVNAIERSVEARTRLVRSWYVSHLGRPAGNGEEQFWVRTLMSGVTEEQVLATILSSAEFLNRAAALYDMGSVEGDFIQGLYKQILGRTASRAEINAWLPHLPSHGRYGIANIFVSSPEYRGRLLYHYYVDILGRRGWPSQTEVAAWAYSGIDLATIRVIFKSSGEFYA